MNTKSTMKPDGLGRMEKGRNYRELDGSEEGIFYFEDKKYHLLVRQVLPMDVYLIKKIRRDFLIKMTCEKLEKGRKVFTNLYEIFGEESDEKILDVIEKGAGGKNAQMAVVIFNTKTKEPICMANVYTATYINAEREEEYDFDKGEIQFSFLTGVLDKNAKMVKRWLKKIFVSDCIFKECIEIVYNPYKDEYNRVRIE